MKTIEKETGCLIGYSDHTLDFDVMAMAANMGAVVIEKHLTLKKTMKGPDHRASLEPDDFKKGVTVVMLLKSDTSTKWFHELILPNAEVRFIKGRLKFNGKPAPFPSLLAIFRQ